MEKYWIILAIAGIFILGMLSGVNPNIPSSVKHSEPDEFESALQQHFE